MEHSQKNSSYTLAVIGMMSAVAFVSNYFSLPIGDVSRIHLGNGFCVLSGILLGPIGGGFCSGIGAFFFDLTNPIYAKEAFITFFMKFFIGFVAGGISHIHGNRGENKLLNLSASVTASLGYVVIYLLKSFISEVYFYRNPIETVTVKLMTKSVASLTNAAAAVVVAMVLAPVFVTAMKRAGIYEKLHKA